ncbi:hypothetical protein M9H77_29907 [Catharanthus roseus]|uniref:Uncharacterized protein n=1 Tax=Catharanthus roseus TaxID=4058 RepID=A0ACB9ZVS2_CATRO|nr:hypothetical protein M9H77_29907 [Catharanthus roseus]
MVKTKNAKVGQGQNIEEGGTNRGKEKRKRVPSGVRVPEVLTRIGGRDIAFDDRISHFGNPSRWNKILYENKKCFDPNLYIERSFEEIFTRGEVLKRHYDRNVNKLDAYRRLLYHMISNIIIPNVGHKSSITNMHSFVMLALHEHRRMNFGYMAIEYMLATQSSSTKCLPYGCFITKIFQYFVINLVGIGDHIGHRNIYYQQTFKRMGFERNDEGGFIRGGQDQGDSEEEDDDEEQEEMHVSEEESDFEMEVERIGRETRRKKRQERPKEGSSSGSISQVMDMIASLQTMLCTRLDALDNKMTDIQEKVMRLEKGGRDRDD